MGLDVHTSTGENRGKASPIHTMFSGVPMDSIHQLQFICVGTKPLQPARLNGSSINPLTTAPSTTKSVKVCDDRTAAFLRHSLRYHQRIYSLSFNVSKHTSWQAKTSANSIVSIDSPSLVIYLRTINTPSWLLQRSRAPLHIQLRRGL